MVKNGPLYFRSRSKAIALQKWSTMDHFFFWSKSKAIALQKWSEMDHSILGQKVRLSPCKNGQQWTTLFLVKK